MNLSSNSQRGGHWSENWLVPHLVMKIKNADVTLFTERGGKSLTRSHPEVRDAAPISQPGLAQDLATKVLLRGGKAAAIQREGPPCLMPEEEPPHDLLEAVFAGP